MCQYGFAQIVIMHIQDNVLHGQITKHFENLSTILEETLGYRKSFTNLSMFQPGISDLSNSDIRDDLMSSFASFVDSHINTWEELVEIWLFQKRTLISGRAKKQQESPFYALFQRDPGIGQIQEIKQTKKRRKLKNYVLNCRHCDE